MIDHKFIATDRNGVVYGPFAPNEVRDIMQPREYQVVLRLTEKATFYDRDGLKWKIHDENNGV